MWRVLSVSCKPFTDNMSLGPQFVPPFVLDKWINGTSWGAGLHNRHVGVLSAYRFVSLQLAFEAPAVGPSVSAATVLPPAAAAAFIKETGQRWHRKVIAPGSGSSLPSTGPACVGKLQCLPHSCEGPFRAGDSFIERSLSRLELFLFIPTSWTGPRYSLSGFSVIDPFSDIFWEAA